MNKVILGLILLASSNIYSGEYQSCVDFGGPCDSYVLKTLPSLSLRGFPVDYQDKIVGVGVRADTGEQLYESLNACNPLNDKNIPFVVGKNIKEMASRYIPAELPRDGGLVCLDTLALAPKGLDPFPTIWLGGALESNNFNYSEFDMYGYTPRNLEANKNLSRKTLTRYIAFKESPTGFDKKAMKSSAKTLELAKEEAAGVHIPLLCDTRTGKNISNPDCGGKVCTSLAERRVQNSAYLGICTK